MYNLDPQSLIPVVMSGIIAVYGLVVSVLIAGGRRCSGIHHLNCSILIFVQLIPAKIILFTLDLSI